jgi:hypothetical protein
MTREVDTRTAGEENHDCFTLAVEQAPTLWECLTAQKIKEGSNHNESADHTDPESDDLQHVCCKWCWHIKNVYAATP